MTGNDIKTQFARRKEDIRDVTDDLFIQWLDHLNRELYRYFINNDVERFIATQSYTVTTSPSIQSLPSDMRDIAHFGTGLFKVDDNGNDTEDFLDYTGFGSSLRGFYITGSNIVFTGIQGETFKMRYVPEITQITSLTDTLSIPDEYIRYVQDGLDRFYEIWDNNPSAEFTADQRYISALDEMLKNYSRAPKVYNIYSSNPAY